MVVVPEPGIIEGMDDIPPVDISHVDDCALISEGEANQRIESKIMINDLMIFIFYYSFKIREYVTIPGLFHH
jgi:hypothetical protein